MDRPHRRQASYNRFDRFHASVFPGGDLNRRKLLLERSESVSFRTFATLLLLTFSAFANTPAADRPNVVLVITDDQGYGDIGAHGNRMLRTPTIDRLHSQSVRLTDFHVDPTCSPTRSALMTGRY